MKNNENRENTKIELTEHTVTILEQLTAGMPGGFFIYHAKEDNDDLIYANNALIKMFGCKNMAEFKDYTGFRYNGMIHPDDRSKVLKSINSQITEGGNEFDYVEYRILRKDGVTRWVEDYGHFLHSEHYGDIFYVFLEDVTVNHYKQIDDERSRVLVEEKLLALEKLEHETTSLKIVHEILGSGMWTIEFNEQGEMESVNWSNVFRKMLGYMGTEDFPDRLESWSDLIHPMDKDKVLKEFYGAIHDYKGDKIFDCEYRMRTKGLGLRWFRSTAKLSRREDGTPITYVGMFVDITRQKEADMALEEQRLLLRDALQQAEKSNRSKTTFLNNMSHDIRTPMNAIIGYTTLAASRLDDQELVKDYLDKIMASSNHLLSIINDVLDMSRIESGKTQIDPSEQNLVDIVKDLKTIVQADVCTKNMKFYIDLSEITHQNIICDKLRINRVLLNILTNAVKFTPKGGTMSLAVSEVPVPESESSRYTFVIEDNGIGMSEEFIKHIFEPFERERSSTVSGIHGTGLGMAITKNIVDTMDGEIDVESCLGKGTKVTLSFEFPVWKEENGSEENGAALNGLKILTVSDDPEVGKYAVKLFGKAGAECEYTLSGEEASDKAQNAHYDLFLVDRQTKDICGRDTAAKLKQLLGDTINIVMMSYDWADLESINQRNRDAAFCSKPLFISDLTLILRDSESRRAIKKNNTSFNGQHILLVEDNELNQEIALVILGQAGLKVDVANNGQESIDMLSADRGYEYALVLMDIQMPVMDGIEATINIRNLPDKKIAEIPIIAMTANAFEEDKKQAFAAGMNAHLGKPIDIDKLMETLQEFLQ